MDNGSVNALPLRSEVALEHTWDTTSVFANDDEWEAAIRDLEERIPAMAARKGTITASPEALADWLEAQEQAGTIIGRIFIYAQLFGSVDQADQDGQAKEARAMGIYSRFAAAVSFTDPELLAMEPATLTQWTNENPRLSIYKHQFDRLIRHREHVRSTEVRELLSQSHDPLGAATNIHGTLTNAELPFGAAKDGQGAEYEVAQGTIDKLLHSADRELRRTAWESYADGHLAFKNTMATCYATGVKRDVFFARANRYPSSLAAATDNNDIPTSVFHNVVSTFRKNLPTWHKYWQVRKKALGLDTFHVWDITAPLTKSSPHVPYSQAVDWIIEGLKPLGEEYGAIARKGLTDDRWVDIYPNKGKRQGAFSTGVKGTHPFILTNYQNDVFGVSTLAHELGHSMHSYFTWHTQPDAYADYSIFVAEVASNFNQALVRDFLLRTNPDPAFQIAVIEEAMANFLRYFFIMPTLARFELESHEREERGEPLVADELIKLHASLYKEGYGDFVEFDHDRIGITWAEFSTHIYYNFYVYQYATGISAAHALANGVLSGAPKAVDNYLAFLKSGSSLYPLDALRLAGVDMERPEPVEEAFASLGSLVDRLETLLEQVG